MSKFLFYFLFFSLNCKAPLNHWEMALNKFIIIIVIIIKFTVSWPLGYEMRNSKVKLTQAHAEDLIIFNLVMH